MADAAPAALKWAILVVSLWMLLFCSAGAIFGFPVLAIPSDVFLVSGGPMMSFATAAGGIGIDYVGPRCTAVLGSAVSGVGYAILSTSSPSVPTAEAYVGLALVTFGGMAPYLSSFSIANSFATPARPIAAITGVFTFSGLCYEGMSQLGLDRVSICLTLAGMEVVCVLLCLLVMPAAPHSSAAMSPVLLGKLLGCGSADSCRSPAGEGGPGLRHSFVFEPSSPAPAHTPPPVRRRSNSAPNIFTAMPDAQVRARPMWLILPSYWRGPEGSPRMAQLMLRAGTISSNFSSPRALRSASFDSEVLSIEYVGMTVWYSVNLAWMNYFYANVGPQVNDRLFCKSLTYIGNGLPLLVSPILGTVIAFCGWGAVTLLTSTFTIFMFLLVATETLWASYAALFFFAMQRTLIFAIFFSYIPVRFAPANYGRLVGLATLVSGFFQYVNTPIAKMVGFQKSAEAVCSAGGLVCSEPGRCVMSNFLLAGSVLPLLGFSAWLHCRLKQTRQACCTSPTSTS